MGESVRWALFLFVFCSSPLVSQITFTENGLAAGIHTAFAAYGVSVDDYDRDGWDDILFVGRYGLALFRNNADGTFMNVTNTAGLNYTSYFVVALWVDWDNDGDDDLYLGRIDTTDRNYLLANENGVFVDVSDQAGIDRTVKIGSAAAGDYDNDGLPDLYLSTRGAYDQLYRNTSVPGSISFENVSDRSGMNGGLNTIGMQPTWIDYDQDGDQDLFVVHDGFDLSRLHQNNGALPFPNLATPLNIAHPGAGNSMGVSWGDVDNDGWEEVYVSRIDSGGLYRYTPGGTFQDIAAIAGVDSNGMTWGTAFGDFDNDGWIDLAMVNTSSFGGYHPASLLFRNHGDGTFSDVAAESGFRTIQDYYGIATGDFDNDGRLDLVGASFQPAGQNRLWMNRTVGDSHWVRFRLQGQGGVSRNAFGARLRVHTQDGTYTRTMFGGSGFCSQMSPVVHVGLGSATLIDSVTIRWKGDHFETVYGLAADSLYDIERRLATFVGEKTPSEATPRSLRISGVYPNPFNGTTHVIVSIARAALYTFTLVDLMGREVQLGNARQLGAGEHRVAIDVGGLASGMYLVRAAGGGESIAARVLLVR